MKHWLITGGAGFIGSHLVDKLLAADNRVTVVDNFDPFYPVELKLSNISQHLKNPSYSLHRVDIRDKAGLYAALTGEYDGIVHLAARAGVRPSLVDPVLYQDVNVTGTQNMLEFARERDIRQFVFASSSSVYGVNPNVPWSEEDHVLKPISPYASTKVSGELLGHVYSHLYGIRFIALRFFTVYGPRQRPDLAIRKFVDLLRSGHPLPVFGDGSTRRDYTFIQDIVNGIYAAMKYDRSLYEVINLGNNQTISLMELIRVAEQLTGVRARMEFHPMQPGDVPQTWASLSKAERLLEYAPKTDIVTGIRQYLNWLEQVANEKR